MVQDHGLDGRIGNSGEKISKYRLDLPKELHQPHFFQPSHDGFDATKPRRRRLIEQQAKSIEGLKPIDQKDAQTVA